MAYSKEQQDLLDRLQIKDFRNLNSQHYLQLQSTIENMPLQKQLALIEQIPNLTEGLRSTLGFCKEEIDTILNKNDEKYNEVAATYRVTIDTLMSELNNDEDLTSEQRLDIVKQIGHFNEKLHELHTENQKFNAQIVDKVMAGGAIICTALVSIIGAIVGVKIIPTKKKS